MDFVALAFVGLTGAELAFQLTCFHVREAQDVIVSDGDASCGVNGALGEEGHPGGSATREQPARHELEELRVVRVERRVCHPDLREEDVNVLFCGPLQSLVKRILGGWRGAGALSD